MNFIKEVGLLDLRNFWEHIFLQSTFGGRFCAFDILYLFLDKSWELQKRI